MAARAGVRSRSSVLHVDVRNNGCAAKFSIWYCLAAGLYDGWVATATFSGQTSRPPAWLDRSGMGCSLNFKLGRTSCQEVHTSWRSRQTRGGFATRFDRVANRGTGPHIRRGYLGAGLTDSQNHSEIAVDAAAEWDRLHWVDWDTAVDPSAPAPVEALG
jgi:hypothetical protein